MSDTTNIMLVEDDHHIALALKIRMKAGGFCIGHAVNVSDALSIVAEELPDICVIDINLPDGNGIDLVHSLMHNNTDRQPVCIVMTASCKPGLKEKALQAGAVAFLEKPFASRELMSIIEAQAS